MPLTPAAALRKDRTAKSLTGLQHRHYAAIAALIASLPDEGGCYNSRAAAQLREHAATRFADALERANPNFDRARFLAACQPEE